MKPSGFTFVELIVVILLLGILSVFVAPRFLGDQGFQARGVTDEIITSIRHAQRLAMTRGDNHRFIINANSYSVERFVAGVSTPVRHPDGSATFNKLIDANVAINIPITPLTIDFDSMGNPTANTALPLTIGVGIFNVIVEQETGYAHL